MSKTYSVITLIGGSMHTVAASGIPLQEAKQLVATASSPNEVAITVDDETDEAIATEVYVAGRKLDPGLVRTIIFGLGRFM